MKSKITPQNIVIRFLILIGLFIITPITLNLSFKAFKIYNNEDQKMIIAYTLLIIGIILVIYTLFHAFITFKKILNLIFNN